MKTPEKIKFGLRQCIAPGIDGCHGCPYEDDECCKWRVKSDALALIECLEAERNAALAKVPRWISIEERMPRDRQVVYMHTNNGRTFKGVYLSHTGFERYKHGDGWTSVKNVAYWTTLPEPPKEDINGSKEV